MAQSHGFDVLLPDHYFCDLVFTGLPGMPRQGTEIYSSGFDMVPGAGFTSARALQRLGLRVGWACDFGSDIFSRAVLEASRREGLDERLFRMHNTPVRRVTVSLSFPADRAFVSFMDEVETAACVPLIERHRPRAVLLSQLRFGSGHAGLAAAAHAVGAIVYMDGQGSAATLAHPGVAAALQCVDIFAPNATEALQVTGAATLEEALAHLAALVPLVVVTLGADGAIARAGTVIRHVPAIDVACVDTTGAGDCFNAGFLYGFLRGASLETCLHCGTVCGGLSTTERGSGAAPTAEQLGVWLQRCVAAG